MSLECSRHGIPRPRLTVEPGRAIVGRAGVTVYRVAVVKRVGDGRRIVAMDGGMSDNPRPALYGAQYPVRLIGRRVDAPLRPATVVGRHCESGDLLAEDVSLPDDVHAGDLLAVPCSGAYHHSMASNYNLVGRPPVVALAVELDKLTVFGPVSVLKQKVAPVGFDRTMTVELWLYPDALPNLELFTKCRPSQALRVAAETRSVWCAASGGWTRPRDGLPVCWSARWLESCTRCSGSHCQPGRGAARGGRPPAATHPNREPQV